MQFFLASFVLSVGLTPFAFAAAATRIDDPKAFVTEVYRRLSAPRVPAGSAAEYLPPEDIYSVRLQKAFRDEKRKSKGEVGCLEIFFWVNGQDYSIKDVNVTSTDQGPDRKVVTARFTNFDRAQELRFDFVRNGQRWVLDEVHSATAGASWTLTGLLRCAE